MSVDYRKYMLLCSIDVEAERTSCLTNEATKSEATLCLLGNGTNYIVTIAKGCVTGFENFGVNHNTLNRIGRNEWVACMGTKGEWDKLVIPKKEMARLHDLIVATIKMK